MLQLRLITIKKSSKTEHKGIFMNISKTLLLTTLIFGIAPLVHAGDNLLLTGASVSEQTNYADIG
jgi:hypothetical protein